MFFKLVIDGLLCLYLTFSDVPHQLMDDQDDAQSRHSIGIVENPLYAEQEGFETPTYAGLSAKEKEAEVGLVNSHLISSLT